MHRFIVYQYGKVGSTSLVNSLNGLPDIEAFQSHFLGEAAFNQTLSRLMDPQVPDYFFEHSAGQLIKNLRIYRHYSRRHTAKEPLTMVSVCREPFDWFRSSVTQDIEGHLGNLRTMLEKNSIACTDDAEVVSRGCELMFDRLIAAVEHCGSVDSIPPQTRPQLKTVIDSKGPADFRAFSMMLNVYLRPHQWFRVNFGKLLQIELHDMQALNDALWLQREDWGNTYLLRYEQLEKGYRDMMEDLGIPTGYGLSRENTSDEKQFSAELKDAFESPSALRLKQLTYGEDSRFLGYGD